MDVHTIATLVPLGLTLALGLLMVMVIVSDTVRYTIPNSYNIAVVVLYAAAVLYFSVSPLFPLAAMALVLAFGMLLFALGLMGGGDVKLIAALTLWTGWHPATLTFLFLTAIAGGLLVLIVLPLRLTVGRMMFKLRPAKNLPRILSRGEPVPYGIAIAAAFLWMLYTHQVPMLAGQ